VQCAVKSGGLRHQFSELFLCWRSSAVLGWEVQASETVAVCFQGHQSKFRDRGVHALVEFCLSHGLVGVVS
jgi:hypothetical protein